MSIRSDLLDASKSEAEGGTGHAKKFWEWTEEQIKSYL
jgi:retinol dehydrogenase-12